MRFALFIFCTAAMFAQAAAPKTLEVNPDRSVTFRVAAPLAQGAALELEGNPDPLVMTKDAAGVWNATTPPLAPAIYGYSIFLDRVPVIDPANPLIKSNLLDSQNMVVVPGSQPMPWEITNIPHGEVHHHFVHSTIVGDDRDFYVYTPPGYDASGKTRYPVLFLLHGFSDDASGWTTVGRGNYIADALIAQGKAKPMLIVMPLGYGAPEILNFGWGDKPKELVRRNLDRFSESLLQETLPSIEKLYRVSTRREDRAIAGLSMGGAESLMTGLNHLDHFAYVGAFSSGMLGKNHGEDFPSPNQQSAQKLRLLWIACGKDDGLIQPNRELKSWLKSKDVRFTDVETPGRHTWMVWRQNLVDFLPLLFR